MSLRERILEKLKERKKKVEEGSINCIPLPFNRFRQDFPGIEQERYYIVTGSPKSGKTQLMNYLFIYNTILYYYTHPDVLKVKVFFFPLEETPEDITIRFQAFLLNYLTHGRYRISPTDMKSTDERKPLPDEILHFMETNETFIKIMEVYEEVITFYDDRNPTGIWKNVNSYAKTHGKFIPKTIEYEELDELGIKQKKTKEILDYYVPDNPDEYVFIVVDHISLIEPEKGLSLRESINKLSDYMIRLRNRYHYIPVVVQQQNKETQNLEAIQSDNIRPTQIGLADSTSTGKDANVLIGITNPNAFKRSEYLGYAVNKGGEGLADNFRILEIVLNRNGRSNGLCPLFTDGAINDFRELPLPGDENIRKYYDYSKSLRTPQKIIVNN